VLSLRECCCLSTQDDIALATDAMNKLQGAVLPSSERGGIRIEYARTKMGDVVSRVVVFWYHSGQATRGFGGFEAAPLPLFQGLTDLRVTHEKYRPHGWIIIQIASILYVLWELKELLLKCTQMHIFSIVGYIIP